MTRLRVQGLRRAEQAEVGIGTIIVFIATVLVAAIAAGVLMDTSGKLSERSTDTGQTVTNHVSSSILVDSALGRRNSTSEAELVWLEIFVNLAPGSANLDVAQLKIRWANEATTGTLHYVDEAWGEVDEFTATAVRDLDGSFSTATPVMSDGDLIRLHVSTQDADNALDLDVRSSATLTFASETGVSIEFGFTTPVAYRGDLIINLR